MEYKSLGDGVSENKNDAKVKGNFPARRGLFSFAFAGLTSTKKKDLCHGSKFTVLSMRGGYLAA